MSSQTQMRDRSKGKQNCAKKTKVPHLRKGRFRDDIDLKIDFFKRHAHVIPNKVRELCQRKQNCAKNHEGPSPAEGQVSG